MKSFYDKNQATFIKPETFKVSHIYVSIPAPGDGEAESIEDRAKAKEIIDWVKNEARKKINLASLALKKGKPFTSVAKEFSEDPKTFDKGGDLGFMMKNQTLPEVSSAMVKLKVGEISSVIESSLGFHIIQLTEKKRKPLNRVRRGETGNTQPPTKTGDRKTTQRLLVWVTKKIRNKNLYLTTIPSIILGV